MSSLYQTDSMKPRHFVVLAIGAALFAVLYFVLDTKPKDQMRKEKSRALEMEATSVQNLLLDARQSLTAEQSALLDDVVQQVRDAEDDSDAQVQAYKQLSSYWYSIGKPAIAGHYAEEVAKRDSTANSWAIAGTTYTLALKEESNERVTSWASNRARSAFENAITMEPDVVDHRINLALTYVEQPLSDNPMKGILMLRQLLEANPQEVKVINQLARLGLRTNQVDKAVNRLETAIAIEPQNRTTICLLAQAYKAAGRQEESDKYSAICAGQ